MSTSPITDPVIATLDNADNLASHNVAITSRSMGPIVADVVIEERHEDDSVITSHPIERGSTISDHKYRQPSRVTLYYGWSLSNSGRTEDYLKNVYTSLLALKDQQPVVLFDIYTGKRHYTNMTIKSLSITTNKDNENILMVQVTCVEVLLATTQVVQFAGVTAADILASQQQQQASGQATNAGQVATQNQQCSACHTQSRGSVGTTPVAVTPATPEELEAAENLP